VEIKIKWIPRKQMTHENTYRDDNNTKADICKKMTKFTFKDVSTKNSEPTYWTILFVMLKMYFIYKVAGKKSRGANKITECLKMTTFKIVFTFDVFLVLKSQCTAKWHVFYNRHFTDTKSCQVIESILKYKNGFKNNLMNKEIFN
jgi:hypothetical protein